MCADDLFEAAGFVEGGEKVSGETFDLGVGGFTVVGDVGGADVSARGKGVVGGLDIGQGGRLAEARDILVGQTLGGGGDPDLRKLVRTVCLMSIKIL